MVTSPLIPTRWFILGWLGAGIGLIALQLLPAIVASWYALAAVGCVAAGLALHPGGRAWIRARRASHALERRRDIRRARIEASGWMCSELADLAEIVDRTTALAPNDAQRWDLEALLASYADLTLTRNAMYDWLQGAVLTSRSARVGRPAAASVQAVRDRAATLRVACRRRALIVEDQLDQISQLIRHYAERCAMPELDLLLDDAELDRPIALIEATQIVDRPDAPTPPWNHGPHVGGERRAGRAALVPAPRSTLSTSAEAARRPGRG